MEQPPVSLTEARERLARHDQAALRVKDAENQVGKLKAEIKDLDRKQAWGAKVRADTIEKLGKVYRDPEAALKAITAEMVWNGSGRTTAKLERTPEAFGKLHGWRVAGGLLTSQPWTILASAERREAVSHAQDAARRVRMLAGTERAVSAAMAGKPELEGKLAVAERDVERRQAELGPVHRYHLVRDVERLERAAHPAERKAAAPAHSAMLATAFDRLEKFDTLSREMAAAKAELKVWDAPAQWSATTKAQITRELAKVYRDPLQAYERIKADAAKHGPARVASTLQREPEAYGALKGTRLLIANTPERRQALTTAAEIGQHRAQIKDRITALRTELREVSGGQPRWRLVRDVEQAAKQATKRERAALPPERKTALEQIRAEQQARLGQQRGRGAQVRGRDDPAPER